MLYHVGHNSQVIVLLSTFEKKYIFKHYAILKVKVQQKKK